jgi:hypothetical protein
MSKIEDEKNVNLASSQEVSPEFEGENNKSHGNIVDLAARAHLEGVEYDELESNAVLRRIDWHLMPLLVWICQSTLYEGERLTDSPTDGLQFADKQTLTFASLMDIRQDIGLDLKSNQYSWCG